MLRKRLLLFFITAPPFAMAYQQQGGLANGPGGSGEHHGPQGTEYTLQGKSHGEACTSDGRVDYRDVRP